MRSEELHAMSELIKRVTMAVFVDSSAWSRYGIEWVLYDLARRVRVVLSEDADRTEFDQLGVGCGVWG